jgi:hypothetical protein
LIRLSARALAAASLALLCAVAVPWQALAQDQAGDLARELAALRAEVQQLRARLDALTGTPAAEAAAPPSLEILQAQVAELAQTRVESTTRLPVRLFGTVHAGVFATSANANWLDNPNIVAATAAGGHGGTTSASMRQTRIGFAADGPTLGEHGARRWPLLTRPSRVMNRFSGLRSRWTMPRSCAAASAGAI